MLEETLQQAADFQREHKLGMLGKAKLGNEFKWRLKELGYSEKFIEVATEGLMVYVTRGASPAASAPAEKKAYIRNSPWRDAARAPEPTRARSPGSSLVDLVDLFGIRTPRRTSDRPSPT